MAYEAYYKHYEDRGFNFDRGLLTSYALSLRTKPFVILSGISGTGKTKIAQFFGTLVGSVSQSRSPPKGPVTPAPPLGEWIAMTVPDFTKDNRTNFKYEELDALLTPAEIAALEPRINQLIASKADDNICDPFDFTIETPDGQLLKAMAYLQRASSPLLRIRFKSKRGESPAWDSTTYFLKNYKKGTVLGLQKVGVKHLKIMSVDDEKVVARVSEKEVEERRHVKNTCFVSVRSDWTDATPLLGYYNLVDQRYHSTQTLNFILLAQENPEIPFFLVLDEMNLAKVEHYFSDFLSCLESRHLEGGELNQEPIHLHAQSGFLESNNDYFDVGPTLALPPNLFVTGTVNIDESTYTFSSKVLDRANVIELNSVDIKAYGDGAGVAKPATFVLDTFPDLAAFEMPRSSDFQSLSPEIRSFMEGVHGILEREHLHFGYRVINEVSRYLLNASKYCVAHPGLLDQALDRQLVQKVLPKLNGPQGKLDTPIHELLTLISTGTVGAAMGEDEVRELDPAATKYPLSAAKLKRMSKTLAVNGFANFLE